MSTLQKHLRKLPKKAKGKMKEKIIIWFWSKVPNSVLYWAVNQAWAKATCREFTDKQPDEVTWSMMQKYLSDKAVK